MLDLKVAKIPGHKKEGYQLAVTSGRLSILAPDVNGLYYGIQTLRQLIHWLATQPLR